MTALPALVLATLALASGCPALCSADAVPEVPDLQGTTPALADAEPAAPEPAVDLTDDPLERLEPVSDPLAILDTLADTRLPGEHEPLQATAPIEAEATPATSEPARLQAEQATAGTDPVEASLADSHVPRDTDRGPTAQGEAAHEPRTWPSAQGEHVADAGAPLTVSLLLGLTAIGLYHKMSKDRALEHPARQRILSMLEAEPGLGTTEVADRLEVCYRTARHHLEVLARFDLVVGAKPRGSWRWARPQQAQAVREPEVPAMQERLLELLEEEPGLHLSEIARRLDAAKATVKHHLDRLDENDLVRDERVGPLRRFFPAGPEASAP